MTAQRTIVAAVLIALLQVAFLGWTIVSRAAVLRDGKEVTLKVEPVDPRDLLRGDYVRLGYGIGQVRVSLLRQPPSPGRDLSGVPLWLRMQRKPDGSWEPVSAAIDERDSNAPGADQVDIRGRVASTYGMTGQETLSVDYGIERFYLPEGEGLQIEKDMRTRPFFVKLAVAADGTPQIKQFLDGATVLYAEPLY